MLCAPKAVACDYCSGHDARRIPSLIYLARTDCPRAIDSGRKGAGGYRVLYEQKTLETLEDRLSTRSGSHRLDHHRFISTILHGSHDGRANVRRANFSTSIRLRKRSLRRVNMDV